MFMRSKDIEGLLVHGRDGEVGQVQDLLVDEQWVARYFVLRPGSWLPRRLVVSPMAIMGIDWIEGRVDIRLTKRQVGESPDLLAVEPLTRQAEAEAAKYYGFPAYWGGPELWAWAGRPGALGSGPPVGYAPPPAEGPETTSKLRSARSFRGRHLVARDGEIGHVDHCIFDDDTWTMPYVVVDTSNWIGGRHVLVPTEAAREKDTMDRVLAVAYPTDLIRSAPEYDGTRPLDRAVEERIRSHYGAAQADRAPKVASRAAGR
jgi:hypothetical protein